MSGFSFSAVTVRVYGGEFPWDGRDPEEQQGSRGAGLAHQGVISANDA